MRLFTRTLAGLALSLILANFATGAVFAADPEQAATSAASVENYSSATLTPEKRASILKLLKLTDADKQVELIINQLTLSHQRRYPILLAQILANTPNISEEKKKELIEKATEQSQRSSERMKELFMQKINLKKVMEEVTLVVYDKNFTESEMKDIIAFYETPTGAKTLKLLPTVMRESMDMTSTLITAPMGDVIKQIMEEERAKLQTSPVSSPVSVPIGK